MEYTLLEIDLIELDLTNPRIARILEMVGAKRITDDLVSLALGSGENQEGDTYASFYSLKESIRTYGGLIQPIIVNRLPDSKYVAIEGNTRLFIYREFKKTKVPGHWDKIPAVVYKNLDLKSIDAIRLQAHLVGPRPWGPYAKAHYLNQLRNSKHMTFDQIVDYCGGRKRQVVEYIAAYNDMESYYRNALSGSEVFDPTRFSSFVELQKVQNAVAEAGFTKTDFARWVIEGLIGRQENVRKLPRIFNNTKAKQAFLEDGVEEAYKILDIPSPTASLSGASLIQIARELYHRVAKIEFKDFQNMKSNPADECREALFDAKAQLDEFASMISGDEGA